MFQPLRDYILIEPIQKSLSAILYAPDKHLSKGKVIATGPGKALKMGLEKMEVKPGDIVQTGDDQWLQFPKYSEAGKDYLIIQQADIVGIEQHG